MNNWEREQLAGAAAGATPGQATPPRIVVLTKADQPRRIERIPLEAGHAVVETSSATGAGLAQLRREIAQAAQSLDMAQGHVVDATANRCGESLRLAAGALARSLALAREGGGEELLAAEIRTALAELGKVVGAVHTDDLLDRIFSRFCIGK